MTDEDEANGPVEAVVGLAAEAQAPAIRLYPNPASHLVTFEWLGEAPTMAVLRDAQGRTCRQMTLMPGNTVLDVSDLAYGLYTLQTGEGLSQRRHQLMICR